MSAFDGQPISHFRTEMAAKNEYLDRFTVVELAIVQAILGMVHFQPKAA
jgi:hypothetical protein